MMTILQVGMDYPNSYGNPSAGMGTMPLLFGLIAYVFYAFCLYKIYQKAHMENSWLAFIPILSYIPMIKMAKKPMWWILLLLIPLVNIIIVIILWLRISKAFGKSELFGIGMVFLAFILLPVLAFSDAQYNPNAIPDESN